MALKLRKNQSPAPPPSCPLTECMALIGGAWTVNVIWYLRAGPRRFSELRVDIPPISPQGIDDAPSRIGGTVVRREVKPTSPPSVEYSLTDLGRELVPAIEAIVGVGEKLKQG